MNRIARGKRTNLKKFDSISGYPREGLARASAAVPKLKREFWEGVFGGRMQAERRLARKGHELRETWLAFTIRRLCAEAFAAVWPMSSHPSLSSE